MKNSFVDTHCHIHFPDYQLDPDQVIKNAEEAGVDRMILVGCTLSDSEAGIETAKRYKNLWASIGIHPHEAKHYVGDFERLDKFASLAERKKVVAIGEIGLDYYYEHSEKEDQKKLLKFQLDIATKHNLPVIFHVREAFEDFWPIFDSYSGIKGVIHSFTAGVKELEQIQERGLYVGLNGIMTFTRDQNQLAAAKAADLSNILLETDAPFLTPKPFRGNICEPKHVVDTAEFLAQLRGEDLQEIAGQTTNNALKLFGL